MSKELNNIKKFVMEKIQNNEVKMKPRIYFIIGSIFTLFGLVVSILTSVFLMGLIRFSIRSHGRMSQYRIDELISNFPWWTTIFAIFLLFVGIWLVRKYDFSYKINIWYIVFAFVLVTITAGWLIDISGINDRLYRNGPMKGMMQKHFPGSGGWINRQ